MPKMSVCSITFGLALRSNVFPSRRMRGVVTPSGGEVTTSEGQSYPLFFALVAWAIATALATTIAARKP